MVWAMGSMVAQAVWGGAAQPLAEHVDPREHLASRPSPRAAARRGDPPRNPHRLALASYRSAAQLGS
jgi:hypothetical protein